MPGGNGSKVQQAIQAVTAVVRGLAGGDISQAAAGGAAPCIAGVIGNSGLDSTGKTLAHAVVNAALSAVQGNNALAGAAGAATGEIMGIIATDAYGKPVSELSETEKQTVSALATLAAGLVDCIAGDSSSAAQAGKTTVENNYLSSTEARQLDKEMQACKASGGECGKVVEKYIEISNQNSMELQKACTGGGVACVTWQELIQGVTNVANDVHSYQSRLDEKLKDPSAAALVNYLNGTDLKFLEDNITTGDRVMSVVMDPTSWPVAIMGGEAIISNGLNKGKEQLIAVGVAGSSSAGIQYGMSGDVKLSDVIGAGVIGAITAGKGYNPTVTWNAAGSYYQAKISGDDPLMAALLSKAGAVIAWPLLPAVTATTSVIGAGASAGVGYLINGEVNPNDVILGYWTGVFTAGTGFWRTMGVNAVSGAASGYLKGDDPLKGGVLSGAASGLGYGAGKLVELPLDKVLNPMKPWKDWIWVDVGMGVSKPLPINPVPGMAGNTAGSAATEIFNDQFGKAAVTSSKGEIK